MGRIDFRPPADWGSLTPEQRLAWADTVILGARTAYEAEGGVGRLMAMTFAQARKIALRDARATDPGVVASPDGAEDATHWLVNVGDRRWVLGGDSDYMLVGDPVILVDKRTGQISCVAYLSDPERFSAMTEVSA